MRRGIVVLVLAACGHSQPPAKTVANTTPKSQCAQVSDHLVSEMSGAQKAEPEQVDPYRRLIEKHCNTDKWSSELQDCLLASKTLQDNRRCDLLFTDEQNANLEHDPEMRGTGKAGDPCEGGQ